MNGRTNNVAVAGVALITTVLVGCSSAPGDAVSTRTEPSFRTAYCNLGSTWDLEAQESRASYSAPTLDASVTADYGPTIANERCSDSDILRWQELRRAAHEDDAICRIVWYDDYIAAITYDTGCAVPVVIFDAAR